MLSGGAGLVIGSGTSIACAVNVSADVVGGVMEGGLRVQMDFAGAPAQVSATAELKPFVGFTVIVTGVLTAPCATVTVVGAALSVKSGGVFVPVSRQRHGLRAGDGIIRDGQGPRARTRRRRRKRYADSAVAFTANVAWGDRASSRPGARLRKISGRGQWR